MIEPVISNNQRKANTTQHLIENQDLDIWQQRKRERMAKIMQILAERQEVDRTKFIAELIVGAGLHRDTAQGYVRDLEDLGVIRVTATRIIWVGDKEE